MKKNIHPVVVRAAVFISFGVAMTFANSVFGMGMKPPGTATPTPTPKPVATPTPAPVTSATPVPSPRAPTAANLKVCASQAKTAGLDVSDYDPGTVWSTVAHGGAGFTFVKATEGTTYVNSLFASDWVNAKANGLYRGAYHFFHPSDDPTVQAQLFTKTMGTLAATDMPPLLDWEVTDNMTAAVQIANAKIWLALVEQETGKTPIIYVDPSFWNELGNPTGFERYPLFIADYDVTCPVVPAPWSNWAFWQTGTGPLSGVASAEADLDVFNGSLTTLAAFIKNANLTPPASK